MEEIKVGEYVRIKNGIIARLNYIEDGTHFFDNTVKTIYSDSIDFLYAEEIKSEVVKHSFNIIDLIEVR